MGLRGTRGREWLKQWEQRERLGDEVRAELGRGGSGGGVRSLVIYWLFLYSELRGGCWTEECTGYVSSSFLQHCLKTRPMGPRAEAGLQARRDAGALDQRRDVEVGEGVRCWS